MPKPIIFEYKKKAPFRDAFFFIVICEGKNREPDYFRFFEGLSSRVRLIPVESSDDGSAPEKLLNVAKTKIKELDATNERDKVWFVIDTDRWRKQIHTLRQEVAINPKWEVAQSNPCFEVWLYFHVKNQLPNPVLDSCGKWKPHLPKVIKGGFNTDYHPAAIEIAISNAKKNHQQDGYEPQLGSTQVWQLAEQLFPLIKRELAGVKWKYPPPEILDTQP